MNRCSVCHELLPGLTQGMCLECRILLDSLSITRTPSPSSGYTVTELIRNQQQLHQQRLNRLSSFPSGQPNQSTIQESSSGED